MKILALILTLLTLVSCTSCGKKKDGVQPFKYSYNAYGTFTGKRVFLAHGNQGSGSDYLLPNTGLNVIHTGLIARGYQVILFSYPKTKVDTFQNASMNYRNEYKAFLDWMIDDAETKYGVPSETMFGGVSLGGLHTFMAVALNSKIDRWFVVVPVADPKSLSEFSSIDSTNFKAMNELAAIASKPGYIVYDDADTRVDYTKTIDLINALNGLGASLTVEVRHGQGHVMTQVLGTQVLNAL